MSASSKLEGDARDRLIVALDVPSRTEALRLADQLSGVCSWVKVGLELYLAAGNGVVEELQRRDYSVFLDLKFHDIPTTVAGAVRSAASLGVSLLTVHAAGGPAMLAAAALAASNFVDPPWLLAVTVLTSMGRPELAATGIEMSPNEQVLRLALMAQANGIDGLVCSAQEVQALRHELRRDVQLVVPGIRPAGTSVSDQKRVATPADAIRAGADMLVVGRPITRAADPTRAALAILEEMNRALADAH